MKILNMYTDGACSGNQNENNLGGWGAVLEFGSEQKELYGGEPDTTNNRMELTAVIQAFKALKRTGLTVRVFTDSSYVANCFREGWYKSWQTNGWRTAAKKPVENRELWQELIALTEEHKVTFYRVKGHVSLTSKTTNLDRLYEKFREWNGSEFSMEDFTHITEMNNRADALANMGFDMAKGEGEL